MKKLIAAATIAGTLIVAGAGVATAEPGADGNGRPGASQSGEASGDGSGTRGGRPGRLLAAALKVAADTIGITPEELRQAVQGGQTVAQVAQSKGVDPQQVTDAIVSSATSKIDEAVTAGRLDEARATKLKEKLPQAVDRLVNATRKGGGGPDHGNRPQRGERRKAVLDTAAGALGISSDELAAKLKSGTSLAAVADELGVELSKVTDALVAAGKQKLTAAVDAGRITADKAEKIEARLAERIDQLVHRTFGQHADGSEQARAST
jgi:ribosomal protein S20